MFCTETLWIVWRGNVLYNDMTTSSYNRDAISDTSEGYPDMADALGVKLTPLEDKMPFAVGLHIHDKTLQELQNCPIMGKKKVYSKKRFIGVKKKGGSILS